MNILMILGMVVATSAVTLMCIQFGMVMTKTPIQAGKVYHTTDERSIAHNRGKLLVVTIPPDTTVDLNVTDDSISRDQQGMRISLPGSTLTVSKNQSPKNDSSFKYLQQGNSKSLSDIGLVQADSFLVKQSTYSTSVDRPTDLRNLSINTYVHNRNGNITTTGDNSESNNEDATENTNKYQINGRQMSRRKINHHRQLNTNMAKYGTVQVEEDSSNGYQNEYDLTYNVGDYGQKEYENPAYETGWTSDGRPEQSQGSLWSGSSGSWEPPPYGTGEGYLADHGPIRKPLDRPSNIPTKSDTNPMQSKLNNVNWKTIVILALFKLGFAKLQAIGFLNTLFQLGFSFKLYLTSVFFKFLLIMKLMKFFKILLLPLFLTRMLPLFIQLVMMPGRFLDLLKRLNDNNMLSNQSGGLLPNQQGGLLPNQQGGLLPSRPGGGRPAGFLPNQPGTTLPGGSTQRGGMVRATGKDIPTNESTAVNYNISDNTNDSLSKLEDTRLIDVQSDESTQLLDPIIHIFQKLLDSEKCVKRIACQISVAEKTGNVPIWYNCVHKFIPSEKLESYQKAYKDVNDEIHAKSSVPDNWVTWCLERYNCDNTPNVSNTRQ